MNQKKCIGLKFSDGLCIFNEHYGYPEIDALTICRWQTSKVVDMQVEHAWKLQKTYELGILDDATRIALASAVVGAETAQKCAEARIFLDYGLPDGGLLFDCMTRRQQ